MAKKSKSNLKSAKEVKPKQVPNVDPEPRQPKEEGNMDLGGLPNRDLKKNLGCG